MLTVNVYNNGVIIQDEHGLTLHDEPDANVLIHMDGAGSPINLYDILWLIDEAREAGRI